MRRMDEHTNSNERPRSLTRRGSLLRLGGLAAGALGTAAWKLESVDDAAGASSGPAAVASGWSPACSRPSRPRARTTSRATRCDATSARASRARADAPHDVLDVSSCKPIRGAAVDIWHCDAGGTYSGFAQEGTEGRTFLRGIQRTDRAGPRDLRDDLPRLVRRPDGAHPRAGARRRRRRPHRPALLPRLAHGRRLSPRAVQPAPESRPVATPPTRSSGTAAAAPCSSSPGTATGYIGRITMGVQTS